MKAKRQVQRQLKRDYRRYKRRINALLGDYSGTVEVPNRPGYVFVRMKNQEVKEAFNKKVPNLVDLPVVVGYADDPREPQILQVLDTQTGVERQKGEDPIGLFIPEHHETHEWFNPLGGQDVVFSDKRQFMPFRPTPIGGMLLHVYRNVGWLNGEYTYFSGSSIDLSPYVPATGAYFGLVYEDTDATLSFSSGTGDFLKNAFTLTLADIPNPTPGTYPIAAVRMWGGMTGIVEALDRTDLIDLRFPFTQNFLLLSDAPHSYTGSGGLGVFVKDDETGLEFAVGGAGGGGGSSSITLFMTEDVAYVTGTFNLDTVVGAKESIDTNGINVSGTSAGSWISQEGELSFVNSGQYLIHFHAFRDGDLGCNLYDVRVGIRVNKRNSGGSHTLLGTLYQNTTAGQYTSKFGETGYTLTGTFASSISFADDEGLLLEFFADPVQTDTCAGSGCGGLCDNPNLTIYYEGTTESGITLPVITAGSPGHIIQDEGTDLTQQNRLNFVGGGVAAVNDPANGRTTVRIPGTVSVFDDGIFQVSGTAIDFGENLDVSVSGTRALITGQAGGGGATGTFIGLTDTPENYFNAAEYFVKVKSDETGLEFVTGTSASSESGLFPEDFYTSLVTLNGYATSRINPNSVGRNRITSYHTGTNYQAIGYWDSDEQLVLGKRVLDGDWTLYTYDGSGGLPNISLTDSDGHRVVSIGIDNAGFIHIVYDNIQDALKYRKSDATIGSWTGGLTAALSMLGTANENSVTYPMFINDPSGNLYFLFSNQSTPPLQGDWYLYKYTHGTTTWAAAAGTSTNGIFIDGKNSSPVQVVYIDYPSFDANFGSGGYLHIAWNWRTTADGTTNHDRSYVKWNGSNFFKADGSAQTVPITLANCEIFDPLPSGSGLTSSNWTFSDSIGRPHIVYPRDDGRGFRQLYHAYYDAGWIIHQITKNETETRSDNDALGLKIPAVALDRNTDTIYVFYYDDADEHGLLMAKSAKAVYWHWTRFVIYPHDIGQWGPKYDVKEWLRSGNMYFSFEYWKSGKTSLPIRLMKWTPAETSEFSGLLLNESVWQPVTDGNPTGTAFIFDDGDTIMDLVIYGKD